MEFTVELGRAEDLTNIEKFVEAAIYPAYDRPDLCDEQRAENARIVSISREACVSALDGEHRCLFVVRSEANELAGFVIVDAKEPVLPEIDWLIVAPFYQGKGVAKVLMSRALDWTGPDRDVKLSVIEYNLRAIRFYEKWGFRDVGTAVGEHKIPRRLMIRRGQVV